MKLALKHAIAITILLMSLPAVVTYVSARHPIISGDDGTLTPVVTLLLCNQHRIIFIFWMPRNNAASIIALWAVDA
jgi:hypothetical protein